MRFVTSLATGATNTNILAGSKFEFMPQAAAILVYAVGDEVVAGSQIMDVTFGNVVEGDNIPIPKATGAGLGPDTQNHLVASGVAAPGDRLQIKIRNTDTVTIVTRVLVMVRPL